MNEPAREGDADRRDSYAVVPAAGYHWLTPCFDCFAGLLGFGRSFKERVVDAAGLSNGDRVLDIGCGSGLLALLVKRRYPACEVVAIDADARILEIARKRIEKARVTGVQVRCARAEETGLEDGSIDAALSTLAFHHLPPAAKEKAAREAARVLRPGGTFLLVDLKPLMRPRRPPRDHELRSTKMAFRNNRPESLAAMLAKVGLQVEPARAPKPWLPVFPTFALRATKPTGLAGASAGDAAPPRPR